MPWLFILVATVSQAKEVTLSWEPSPSVIAGYKIYYKENNSTIPFDGSGSPITVGNVLTYTITNLPDDYDHYFALTAYDAAGYESSYSNIVKSLAVAPLPKLNLNINWEIIPKQ